MIDALLRASWQGALCCLCVAALSCLPRLSANLRAWLWRLVVVKFLLALLISSTFPVALLPPSTPLLSPPAVPESLASTSVLAKTPVPASSSRGMLPQPQEQAVLLVTPRPQSVFSHWETAVLALYLLGALAALVHLLQTVRQAHQWRRQALGLHDPVLLEEARALARTLRLRSLPALVVSPVLTSPAILGVFSPVIALPERLLAAPDARRIALAHELAHARRRDLFWSAVTAVSGVLFWFHPLVWLTRRELAVSQEMACDSLAVEAAELTPSAYGQTLLTLALPGTPSSPLVIGSASHLKRRLLALQKIRHSSRGASLVAVTTLALVVFPWHLTYAQQPDQKTDRSQKAGQQVQTGQQVQAGRPQDPRFLSEQGPKRTWTLVDEGNALVNEAKVVIRKHQPSNIDITPFASTKTTYFQGKFSFPLALLTFPVTLYVEKDGKLGTAELTSESQELVAVRWQTHGLATLTGRVVDEQGKPIDRARVRVYSFPWAATLPRHVGIGEANTVIATGADGRFSYPAWPDWQYSVEAEDNGYGKTRSGGRQSVQADKACDFGNLVLRRADAVLVGRALDAQGKPLVGVLVQVYGTHSGNKDGRTDAQGRVRIAGLVNEKLAVHLTGYSTSIRVTPGGAPFTLRVKTPDDAKTPDDPSKTSRGLPPKPDTRSVNPVR